MIFIILVVPNTSTQFYFIFCFLKTLRSLKKVTSSIAKEVLNDQTQIYTKNVPDFSTLLHLM